MTSWSHSLQFSSHQVSASQSSWKQKQTSHMYQQDGYYISDQDSMNGEANYGPNTNGLHHSRENTTPPSQKYSKRYQAQQRESSRNATCVDSIRGSSRCLTLATLKVHTSCGEESWTAGNRIQHSDIGQQCRNHHLSTGQPTGTLFEKPSARN